jgi:acyl dehydratase
MTSTKPGKTFASLKVGDQLPPFEIAETQETIDGARNPEQRDENPPQNIHNDPGFAQKGIFAGTVNAGVTTMAYITQMLEQWFSPEALYNGGSLTLKAIEPFRPGDRVVFTGGVTAKRTEGGKKVVELEVKGINQSGCLVGMAEAAVFLDR